MIERYGRAVRPPSLAVVHAPMPDTTHSSLTHRRYRLAQVVVATGSLAIGSMLVSRLVAFFRADFFLYYGVSEQDLHEAQRVFDSGLPITASQLMVATLALLGTCAFVWLERRRVQQDDDRARTCRGGRVHVVERRLGSRHLLDTFVLRTSMFAGILLLLWLVQSCLERWLGGLGWGLQFHTWTNLLPIASVFGVCVLAGMVVAAVSMFGLRTILLLERVLAELERHARNCSTQLRRPAHAALRTVRTVRERIGCDILSRPPPALAY